MGLHTDQVHDATKILFFADGKLHGHGAAPKHFLNIRERTLKTCEVAVHPINYERARQFVFRAEIPHFFSDDLHAGVRVNHNQRAIGGNQAGARFIHKRAVARRVQKINFSFFGLARRRPFGVCQRRLNGNFAGDFFFVPIGDSASFRNFSETRGHSRSVKQRRHQLRFPGGAVAYNAYISYRLCVVRAHRTPFLFRGGSRCALAAQRMQREARFGGC